MTLVAGVDPVEAMDRIQLATFRIFQRLPGAEYGAADDVAFGSCGAPLLSLNTVTNAQFDEAGADARIGAVDGWFRERGMPYMWFVGPADRPRDLADRLLAHGLTEDPEGAPGMAAPIDPEAEATAPGPMVVEEVTTAAGWAAFCDVMTEGFEAPREFRTVMGRFADLGFRDDDPWRAFLVLVEGEPAGTALAVVDGDAAGLFNVATVPAWRRRGVGRTATLAALRFSADRGSRIAVLQTSPMGRPVYARLGFTDYASYRVFIRQP